MSPDEALLYESRVRSRQVAVAIIAGVCLIIASVVQLSGPHTKVDELTLDLLVANQRFPLDLISSVINAIGSLAIAWTLLFLFRAARVRNPEKVRPYIRILTMVGGGLAAVAGIVYAAVVAIKVHEFATTGSQTYAEANHLTSGAGLLGLQLIGQAAALLVAVAFVLVSLQAMNQGLLSRFMGYLGMFAGALVLFQITQVPVVQTYLAARHRLPHLRALAHRRAGGLAIGPLRAVAVIGRDARPAGRGDPRAPPACRQEAGPGRRRRGARGHRRAPRRPHAGHHAQAQAQAPQLSRGRPWTVTVRRGSRPFGGAARPPADLAFAQAGAFASFRVRLVNSRRRRDGSSQFAVPRGRRSARRGPHRWPPGRLDAG